MTDWRQIAQFFVPGDPVPQPRPRARVVHRRAGASFAQIYNPSAGRQWKHTIGLVARSHAPPEPLAGPVRLDLQFLLSRPKRLLTSRAPDGPVPHTSRPDLDNLAKAVADALGDAGDWWGDDAQVCAGSWLKLFAGVGNSPGVWIRISSLPDDQRELFAGAAACGKSR